MRGLWLAATASCCLSSSPSKGGMAPLPTAAAASLIPRGSLGFTASRARLLVGGNRRGGQSLAAAAATAAATATATATTGFMLPSSTTSTWISRAQQQRGYVTATVQRRRPRVAAYTSRNVVAAPACVAEAVRRPSQRFFSSSLERATTAAPAVVGLAATKVEGDLEAVATEGEEEKEEGPAPFKVNLLEMSNAEVEAFLVAMGEPKFRAKQVLKWIFEGGAESFEDMANIPKTLRAKLAKVATVGALEV
ncbi:unnamed protein product, partial [Ectocarpus sp. 12 AP-2014]